MKWIVADLEHLGGKPRIAAAGVLVLLSAAVAYLGWQLATKSQR